MAKPKGKVNTAARAMLKAAAKGLPGVQVQIGVFEGKKATPRKGKVKGNSKTLRPPTQAEVALWNHEGVPERNMPRRPFLTQNLSGHSPEVQKEVQRPARLHFEGKLSLDDAAGYLGVWGQRRVVQSINNRDYVPNAASTIKAKGSDTPLVDAGTLKSDISYEIVKGKGVK